jgi:thymidylate synthase ThyX
LRLGHTTIDLHDGDKVSFGSLLNGSYNKKSNRYTVSFNQNLLDLFIINNYTRVNFNQRLKLKRKPLAQWLHSFYQTHKYPNNLKVETIKDLCGSEAKNLTNFKYQLNQAIGPLMDATGWVMEFNDNNLLEVTRVPVRGKTQAQADYLRAIEEYETKLAECIDRRDMATKLAQKNKEAKAVQAAADDFDDSIPF